MVYKRNVQASIKQMNEPIIGVAGGYMPYYAKKGATPEVRRLKSVASSGGRPYTESVPLYKYTPFGPRPEEDNFMSGTYKGNYILYRYYNKTSLGRLGMTPDRFAMGTAGLGGDEIIDSALSHIAADVRKSSFSYTGKFDKDIKAVEEQPMVPGMSVPERPAAVAGIRGRPHGVDTQIGNKNFQVTNTAFLAKMGPAGHHGIENQGDARSALNASFREAKENQSLTAEQKYKQMANAGLTYFKSQTSNVNKIMASMQKGKAISPRDLGSEIKAGTVPVGKKGAKFMAKNGKLIMNNAMIQFTKTALFNVDRYRQGVYYTIPLTDVKKGEEPVYAKIGQFRLSKRGKIRFLNLKEAHVEYGMDATTRELLMLNSNLEAYDVNAARTHGQMFSDMKATSDTITTNAITTGAIGSTLSNSSKIYPSIDLMAADRGLSEAVAGKGGLLEFVKDASELSSKSFSANAILGRNKRVTMAGITLWALPYLSIYDGKAMRFGAQ
tara:strand:- start:917 stop:2404 length:1488 start_codon:yes stop_codon:yes gene_type:complete